LGGPFPQHFIDAVRDAADIVQVISDYVPLKRAGARLKGLCPFHQEKTPSFSVDPNAQLFYCFGCQTGGDAFKFIQLYEKADFGEAVKILAQRFGVPVPAERERKRGPEERLLRMMKEADEFYRSRLRDESTGRRCREYLEKRGIGAETIEKLGLGYAPDSWEALRGHLLSKRFRPEEMQKGGLVLLRKSGQGHYDRFRDRLIFPIRNLSGRTVAFGGRALGDAEPKYINSPETPVYVKGNLLYGLDLAKKAIRREQRAIVVEGYLDLAAVLQAGFENVVASLGTAFTQAQARLLARYAGKVAVSYDGDTAGAAATVRSLDLLLEKGLDVRVVELPADSDPDDFIKEKGAEAYGRLLDDAPEYLQFLVRRELRTRDIDRIDGKIAAANAVLPHVAKLGNAIERASWAGRLADALHIEDDLILQELRAATKVAQTAIRQKPESPSVLREAEARMVSLLLRSEEDRLLMAGGIEWEDLAGTEVVSIIETILRLTKEGKQVDYPEVLSALEGESDRDLLTQIAFREEPEEGPSVEDCLWACRRQRLAREGREVTREIGAIQSGKVRPADVADVDERLMHLQKLAKQRDALY
jgi:DNA primase